MTWLAAPLCKRCRGRRENHEWMDDGQGGVVATELGMRLGIKAAAEELL